MNTETSSVQRPTVAMLPIAESASRFRCPLFVTDVQANEDGLHLLPDAVVMHLQRALSHAYGRDLCDNLTGASERSIDLDADGGAASPPLSVLHPVPLQDHITDDVLSYSRLEQRVMIFVFLMHDRCVSFDGITSDGFQFTVHDASIMEGPEARYLIGTASLSNFLAEITDGPSNIERISSAQDSHTLSTGTYVIPGVDITVDQVVLALFNYFTTEMFFDTPGRNLMRQHFPELFNAIVQYHNDLRSEQRKYFESHRDPSIAEALQGCQASCFDLSLHLLHDLRDLLPAAQRQSLNADPRLATANGVPVAPEEPVQPQLGRLSVTHDQNEQVAPPNAMLCFSRVRARSAELQTATRAD